MNEIDFEKDLSDIKKAKQALENLIQIAQLDTGQSVKVRRFLLGLYNGYDFPFSLVELRGIDNEILCDITRVLYVDSHHGFKDEIHVVTNQQELFSSWAKENQDENHP